MQDPETSVSHPEITKAKVMLKAMWSLIEKFFP